MTYDKQVYYINNQHIVDSICKANSEQLNAWLTDLKFHIAFLKTNKEEIKISLLAEKEMIENRFK